MSTFYTATCINHAGTTYKADGARYYTEIISEYLLEHYDLFDQIQKIKRGNYKIGSHNGTTPRETSNRKEERIALALAQKKVLNPLGEVIDYQVPLKSGWESLTVCLSAFTRIMWQGASQMKSFL